MKFSLGNTLQQFRIIAYLEGVSFILLLFIAMPLKYWFDSPLAVRYIGMAHGVLFVAYVILLVMLWREKKWETSVAFMGFIASLVPFGTFWFDKKIRD